MVIRIGKFLSLLTRWHQLSVIRGRASIILLICLFAHCLNAIKLQVLSADGYPLVGTVVGVPFLLEVQLEDDFLNSSVTVPGIEHAQILDTNYKMFMRITNGQSTTEKIVRYVLQVNTPQELTFGPLSLSDSAGNYVASNSVSIMIKERQSGNSAVKGVMLDKSMNSVAGNADNQKNNQGLGQPAKLDAVTCSWELAKKKVVIGEQIPFVIKVRLNDPKVHLQGCGTVQRDGFELAEVQGPFANDEADQNVIHRTLEWRGAYYAQRAGTFVLPGVTIEFVLPMAGGKANRHFLDVFGFNVNRALQHHTCTTQENKLIVEELPSIDPAFMASAIGEFTTFTLDVSAAKAIAGEGILLVATIEGAHANTSFTLPPLAVPEELRYYDSKSTVAIGEQGFSKSFEYVLQGLKPGSHELPSQTFTFFDTKTRTYQTLHSNSLSITIEPAKEERAMEDADQSLIEPIAQENLADDLVQNISDNRPVTALSGLRQESDDHSLALPLWLFIMFAFLPIIGFSILTWYPSILYYGQWYFDRRSHKRALFQALKQLSRAKACADIGALYPIMKNALAGRLSCKPDQLTDAQIEQELIARGCDETCLAEWRNFITKLLAHSFYKQQQIGSCKELIEQAYYWIDRLGRVL